VEYDDVFILICRIDLQPTDIFIDFKIQTSFIKIDTSWFKRLCFQNI